MQQSRGNEKYKEELREMNDRMKSFNIFNGNSRWRKIKEINNM